MLFYKQSTTGVANIQYTLSGRDVCIVVVLPPPEGLQGHRRGTANREILPQERRALDTIGIPMGCSSRVWNLSDFF